MASIRISGSPEAEPAAEPWPADEHTIRIDEMFARKLDTEFATGVRGLLHDPETGLSSLSGEVALEAIAGIYPALEALRQRTLANAIGPRQRGLVEPAIDTRLDWAAGTIGRLAERATIEVDDRSVAERLAGLRQDAETAWHDPAWLRQLGRTTVTELRWQGERRGWDQAETETRARAGLSDLYAGAVEAAIAKDVDGGARLLAHAREAIDPARREIIDHRLARARADGVLHEVDAALATLPLDPTAPPALDAFAARTEALTPEDATDEVRARLGELASYAQRRAERQWHRRQAEAGIAALEWLQRKPTGSWLGLPPEVRDWLVPDQVRGLETLLIDGRLRTDSALFERLDRQMVYEPDGFAARDLDRHRLSLDDEDHARFAGAQKAIAEDRIDPAQARWVHTRIGVDRALKAKGIDLDGPAAVKARAGARDQLAAFEAIEGRPPVGADLDEIVRHAVDGVVPDTATDPAASEPHIVHNDDGSAEIAVDKVATPDGPAAATVRIDRDRRGASAAMVLPDGRRVESRRTSPDGRAWSQVDTIRTPDGAVVGTQTTGFDGMRYTRIWQPADGPAQTANWEPDQASGDVHRVNAGVEALGALGAAGALVGDALAAGARVLATEMLALATGAVGLAGTAAAGLAAGAAVLLAPGNSGGATTELGDGLRVRQPPGDATSIVEKSALGGMLWDEMPVAARIDPGVTPDGRQILTIDATALEQAIGPEAAGRVLAEAAARFDVVPIYTSRPPREEPDDDKARPPLDDAAPTRPEEPPPEGPDLRRFLPIAHWLARRLLSDDRDRYAGADGVDTAVGVRLDPRVGEPAAGRDYLPDQENHRKGLRGEYGLANDIARHFPDHTVVEFGRTAGERGPDVISVSGDGTVHFWDSKWRGADTSIGPGGRAHRTKQSFDGAVKHAEDGIRQAVNSGRLSPEAGAKALESLDNRSVTIVTVGTGSARNGVIERIVGGERAVVHPQRR